MCCPSAIMTCHAQHPPTVCNSKGDDGIPRPMSSDCVCCPKVIMECDALRHSTMCIAKDHVGIPRPTSSDRMCCPRDMMAGQAQRCQTVYSAHGPCMHATPIINCLCVQSKGDDGMSCSTSSDCVCCLKAIMAFLDRCRPTICSFQGRQ